MLAVFALIALLLSAAGLFAVLSHSVAERRREIGIRMAVGARQTQVLRQIAGDTLRLTLPGALIGAIAAYVLSGPFLRGISDGVVRVCFCTGSKDRML